MTIHSMHNPKSLRRANKATVAAFFDVSLSTVDGWIRRGCPFIQSGSLKSSWQFDMDRPQGGVLLQAASRWADRDDPALVGLLYVLDGALPGGGMNEAIDALHAHAPNMSSITVISGMQCGLHHSVSLALLAMASLVDA